MPHNGLRDTPNGMWHNHPSTNRARCALTLFTRRTPLTTTPQLPRDRSAAVLGRTRPMQSCLHPRPVSAPRSRRLRAYRDRWTPLCAPSPIYTPAAAHRTKLRSHHIMSHHGWLGSRVVGVLDSGAEGPGFKSQPRRCRVAVLGKLFTPVVPLFTKQRNW